MKQGYIFAEASRRNKNVSPRLVNGKILDNITNLKNSPKITHNFTNPTD